MSEYSDSTKISRINSEQKVIIEHSEYKTVVIRYDKVKQRMRSVIGYGSSFASIGYKDLMERSYGGIVVTVELEEGGSIEMY